MDKDAESVSVGIEFYHVPLTHSSSSAFDQDVSFEAMFNFSLPVHLRYQTASFTGAQFGEVKLSLPQVYVRKGHGPPSPSVIEESQMCGDTAGEASGSCEGKQGGDSEGVVKKGDRRHVSIDKQKKIMRYFDVTHLGRASSSYSALISVSQPYHPTFLRTLDTQRCAPHSGQSESFEFKGHICLVFELLSMSLLDVLTQNQFRGLSLSVVQRFTRQILTALVALQDANVIHCDLKPENILLVPPPKRDRSESSMAALAAAAAAAVANANANRSTSDATSSESAASAAGAVKKPPSSTAPSDLKVIDFGSACFEGRTIYSYIQSRFYRSPEVLLGMPYNGAIDMWSLACVCAEMYLGLPLFPGVSQHNQLSRIVEMLGAPPDFLIECKNGAKYFSASSSSPQHKSVTGHKSGGSIDSNSLSSVYLNASTGKYRLKSAEEYAAESNTEVPVLKKYLRYSQLDEVVMKCPLSNKSKLTPEQKHAEMMRRRSFLDFLQGLFNLNPFDRWTAQQAMGHPFITNTPFSGVPFQPAVDLKAKERKLVYMYQTKQFAVDGDSTPGGMRGLRAPTNFGSNLGNAVVSSGLGKHAFVPLQAVNRRLTEPMDTGGSKSKHLLQPGVTVSAKTVTQIVSPPVTSRPVSLQQTKKESNGGGSPEPAESRPSLKRGNPVHAKAGAYEESDQRQPRQQHQHHHQGSPTTSQSHMSHAQMRQQHQPSASVSIPMATNSVAPQQLQQQMQAPYMQQYQHQQQQQQYAASLNSSTMGAYAAGGTMQDGSGGGGMVVMTDFGLALLRPDMDEHRRLLSQNTGTQQYYQQPPHLLQQQQQQYVSSPGAYQGKSYSQQQQYSAGGPQQYFPNQSVVQSQDHSQPNSPTSRFRQQQSSGRQQQSMAHSPTASSSRRTYKAAYTQKDQGSPSSQIPPVAPLPPPASLPVSSSSSSSSTGAASSLSISIPSQLAAAPNQEQVLAYSFQNPQTGSSVAAGGSINYSNQWENTSMAAAASVASLSRSIGQSRSVSSIQQHMRRSTSKEAVAALEQECDETEVESCSGSSPKDVTYKASERSSESSVRSISSAGSEDGLRKSKHTSNGNDQALQSASSESSGSVDAATPGTDDSKAVAVVADALADWDPFFDSDD
eukprot:gene22742-28900_t